MENGGDGWYGLCLSNVTVQGETGLHAQLPFLC